MSETMHWVIFCGGAFLISLPFTVIGWKRADREATKLVDKLTPPEGIALTDESVRWLRRQFARRLQWAAVTTQVAICVTAPLVFGFQQVPLVDEAGGPMYGVVAVVIGHTLGVTYATVHSARASTAARRSASLSPRTLCTYLRGWERALYLVDAVVAPASLVVVAVLWHAGRLADGSAAVFGLLATVWVLAMGGIRLLQRSILRTPPVVDEDLHLARELMLSFAVRSLLLVQIQVVGVVGFIVSSYAYLTVDGFPWPLSVAPLYGVGAIALGLYVVRVNREDRGDPAPEWYFARRLEIAS